MLDISRKLWHRFGCHTFSLAFRSGASYTVARMASTLPRQPIFEAIASHDLARTAVVHNPSGRSFTYGELALDVSDAAKSLKSQAQGRSLEGERVAFLVENSYDYVVTLLSIFASDAVAVPLCTTHPSYELRYILDQSQAAMLLASERFKDKAQEVVSEGTVTQPIVAVNKTLEGSKSAETIELVEATSDLGGLMLYTSGTTSRPKGVLLPQSALTAQSQSLLTAWKYTKDDHLLHVLPLHHIHGVINALLTPLLAGSSIEFMYPFNPTQVWERFAAPFMADVPTSPTPLHKPISFFTVVPTIYNRLLSSHTTLPAELQTATRTAISPSNLRVNISGSAALPTPTKQAWSTLSNGNVLLERYGMTEVGMALSCGLDFRSRVDGSVGWPLPGVEARLVDTDTNEVIVPGQELDANGRERHGEIQLRGATIFKEYFRNPEATAKDFVEGEDGNGRWFKTGDVAVRRVVDGAGESQSWTKGPMYFIQGRKSADIIKTGGEKVSALEIEREMLSLPEVSECAIVALPSDKWGQKVAAIVVLTETGRSAGKGGKQWSPLDMRRALKEKLANYKIPQDMRVVETIPRNAMGKVNKKELVKLVYGDVSD